MKTYIIPSEDALELAKHIYKFMVQRALNSETGNDELADFFLENHDEVLSVIIGSMVFTVSNIDKIPKVECEAEMDDDQFIVPTGGEIEIGMEQKSKEKTPKYVS